jgi:DNA-binding transcriptional LysR family regulator
MKTHTYPNPWDLRYFQVVASTGNLSRAAEKLGVSQPALSLSIRRLEESLKTRLFLRRSRGLELTAAGRRLSRTCQYLLAAWEAVISQTRHDEDSLSGRFKIGCHPSVGLYTLRHLLPQVYSQYPNVECDLIHGASRVMTEGVISGTIDFGLVVNPIRHPDLVIHQLAKDEVCFWQTTKSLSDVLIYNPELAQSQALLKKLKQKLRFKRFLTTESLEIVAALTSAGAGVGILPSRVVEMSAPHLKRLPLTPSYTDEIAFVYRADLPKTEITKRLIDIMRSLKI